MRQSQSLPRKEPLVVHVGLSDDEKNGNESDGGSVTLGSPSISSCRSSLAASTPEKVVLLGAKAPPAGARASVRRSLASRVSSAEEETDKEEIANLKKLRPSGLKSAISKELGSMTGNMPSLRQSATAAAAQAKKSKSILELENLLNVINKKKESQILSLQEKCMKQERQLSKSLSQRQSVSPEKVAEYERRSSCGMLGVVF